jgi:hypothetical protein
MSNELKEFFKLIVGKKAIYGEAVSSDRMRQRTEQIEADISGDIRMREKHVHVTDILEDITMGGIPERLEDGITPDISGRVHSEKSIEVCLTDVEEVLGEGREHFEDITDFLRVKRRIDFGAVTESIVNPSSEQETVREGQTLEYEGVDIQLFGHTDIRDEIQAEQLIERSKIEGITVVVDLESHHKQLEVHEQDVPLHVEAPVPELEPVREVFPQLLGDFSSQLVTEFLVYLIEVKPCLMPLFSFNAGIKLLIFTSLFFFFCLGVWFSIRNEGNRLVSFPLFKCLQSLSTGLVS